MGSSISNTNQKKTDLAPAGHETKMNITELDILMKAYEVFLENTNHCFGCPDFSFIADIAKQEIGEFNPII